MSFASRITVIRPQLCRRQATVHLRFARYSTPGSQQQLPEAYLEPLESHPGVTCLSLNRPQSKNAISTTMLRVSSNQPFVVVGRMQKPFGDRNPTEVDVLGI